MGSAMLAPPAPVKQKLQIPEAYGPLLDQGNRKRYYVAYGGRDSAKSWTFAAALLLLAQYEPLRILCAREIQRTIADSVHRLLSDLITLFEWEDLYEIQDARIVCRTSGAEFIFAGLRDQDAHKIKSFEGVDIVWVEEAHTVTKRSWNILIPTIRAERSEVWVTFNPELDTDETYQRFVVHPPANAWVQKVSWEDNPWFSKVLNDDREKMRREDPQEYDNVWEGNPRAVVAGAIYAKEVTKLVQDRRFRPMPYDPALKVHTVWDLGWNDANAIILVQRGLSDVRLIGYIEDEQRTLAEYVTELNTWPVVWGTDWIPHDGAHKNLQTGKSTEEQLKKLGRKPKVIPKLSVEQGIKATRMLLPRVYMNDAEPRHEGSGYRGCTRLLDCMKRYKRGIPQSTGEPGAPVHDEYSHGADAMRGLAVIVDKITNEDVAPPGVLVDFEPLDKGMGF